MKPNSNSENYLPALNPALALSMLVACCATGFAADAPASSAQNVGGPKIEFDNTTFNFGRVKSGETVKHSFVFTNTGNATLEITEVKPGCGCTTAGTWDKTVEPGRTGIIPLQFNSTGFGGLVSKSATITCNDAVRSNLFLQLSGSVWRPIDITPQMAMFNVSSELPTNETKVLKIVSNLEEPVALSELKCNSPFFQAELKEVKPGKEFELHLSLVLPLTNASAFSTVTFKSSSTNAPNLTVSAYAVVQQAVTVSPQQVTLPAGPLKSALTTAVLVRNNGTNSLVLSDVQLDIPGVEVKLTAPQTGQLYSVSMTFPAGFEVPPGKLPILAMKSNHPKFAEIKIPVVQNKPAPVTPAALSSQAPQLRTASVTPAGVAHPSSVSKPARSEN